jgi:predicted alpha/beta superfamily hydrolase
MSPSLWFGDRGIIKYIEQDGRPPGRLYVDTGTEEGATTVQDARRLAEVLERRGYVPGQSLLFSVAHGGRHEEEHWADRLVPALEFLLPVVVRRRRRATFPR